MNQALTENTSDVKKKLSRMGELNIKVNHIDFIMAELNAGKLEFRLQDNMLSKIELPDDLKQSINRQIIAHYEYEKKLLIEEAEKIIKGT